MVILISILVLFFAIVGFGAFFGAPYVPSLRKDAKRMFDSLYTLNSEDVVIDFGSGDGLILREVSRRGARAIGYEVNPLLVFISRMLSRKDPNVTIRAANFWLVKFPQETTQPVLIARSFYLGQSYLLLTSFTSVIIMRSFVSTSSVAPILCSPRSSA